MNYTLTTYKDKNSKPMLAKTGRKHCHGTGTTGTFKGSNQINTIILCRYIRIQQENNMEDQGIKEL
jgi:hypothetical protein